MNEVQVGMVRILNEQSKRDVVGGSPCPCGKYGASCQSWVDSNGRIRRPVAAQRVFTDRLYEGYQLT